ncbi:MAG: VWA domain-containing protein [Gemmatimonadetes bacterium]|nr:MAG: VWA domain-containing protein [Gemmatimonadota bacterium]
MKTDILMDHEPVADGGHLVRALMILEGEPPSESTRTPLNLALVLDRSGSMAGEPLAAARRAAAELVRRLWPEDTACVVAFDDTASVVAGPASGPEHHATVRAIERIGPGGCTNLSGGWLLGRELAAGCHEEGRVSRIILLTDGLANRGITDPAALAGLCREAADGGITTTTIGFGPHFDEDLLRAMADAGSGGAYYVERVDQTVGIFAEELEGLMSLAAQNVRVSVTPGPATDDVTVLHDYPMSAEGDTATLEVGDLYGREPRRILFRFLVRPARQGAPGEEPEALDVARVRVTAQVITGTGSVEQRTIDLPLSFSPSEGATVHPEIRKEVLLVEAARAREEALQRREAGDWQGAARAMHAAADHLRMSCPGDAAVEEEARDLRSSAVLCEQGPLMAEDVKYLKHRIYVSMRSRQGAKEKLRRD